MGLLGFGKPQLRPFQSINRKSRRKYRRGDVEAKPRQHKHLHASGGTARVRFRAVMATPVGGTTMVKLKTAAAPVVFRRLRRDTGASAAAAAVYTTKMARTRSMAAQLTVLCGLGS